MEKENDILTKINGKSGMTVPEGYFADFAKRMSQELPPRQTTAEEKMPQRTLWQQVRPYVYLAAMFMGIWCMLKMFTSMGANNAADTIDSNPTLISAISDTSFFDDIYYEEGVNSYDVLEAMYDDGYATEDFTEFVSLK